MTLQLFMPKQFNYPHIKTGQNSVQFHPIFFSATTWLLLQISSLASLNQFQELKKLQEQFAAEQGGMFGTKPSPIRPLPARKPLGQSSNVNIVGGTPTSRHVVTPMSRKGGLSSGKVKETASATATPANYIPLPKDCGHPLK
jgi:hypothetical protein